MLRGCQQDERFTDDALTPWDGRPLANPCFCSAHNGCLLRPVCYAFFFFSFASTQESLIQETESSSDMELLRAIFSVETTRVKYMLRSYLRTRLLKIERFAMYCMDKPEMRARLSPQEDAYAEKYVTLVGHHLADNVTKKLPDAFASVTRQASAHPANDMIPAPDLGRHVFARVLRDLGNVAVYEDGGTAELAKDDLYILRYNMLRPLLEQRAVQLC
jgi:GINS complex subunit 4